MVSEVYQRGGAGQQANARPAAGDESLGVGSSSALIEYPSGSPLTASAAAAATVHAPLGRLVLDMFALALPITVSNAAQFSVVTVNLSFVGRLGVAELGGAATGVMITNSTAFAVANGFCGALDTLLSQIYGANPNDRRYGRETQRMCAILLCCAVPVAFLWWNVGSLLRLIGQPDDVVKHTSHFVRLMLPGLPAIMGLEVLKRYMQAQHVTAPITIAVFVAAVVNPIVLTFWMDSMGLSYGGSPVGWVTILTGMTAGLLLYLYLPMNASRCSQTWGGIEVSQAFTGWKPLLRLGLPCLGITLAEWTTFELNGVAASFTNATDLAAYSITNQIATLAWTVISGLASAVCVVVGNAVGAGSYLEARRCAVIGLMMGLSICCITGMFILSFAPQIAGFFTDDPAVQRRVGDLAPILATYQVLDAIVSVVNAIARGIGRQRFIAMFTSFALLCIGVPIGVTMTFWAGRGVGWLMAGPAIGIFISLIVYSVWFYRLDWRGVVPAFAAADGKRAGDDREFVAA